MNVMKQYIGFKLNGSEFTLPILKVREIVNTPIITRLPQSPGYVEGIINLRGQIIPVIDLKELVGMGETVDREKTKTIVVTNEHRIFGILVDEITSVVNIDESNIEPAEGFMQDNLDRVEGVAKFDDRLVILLDTSKLVDMEEMDMLSMEQEDTHLLGGGDIPALDDISLPPAAETVSRAATATPRVTAAPAETPATETRPEAVLGGKPCEGMEDARELIAQKYSDDDVKGKFVSNIVELIEALAANDFERADAMIREMLQYSEGSLYQRIGNVTRKLHNSLKEFRKALDPRIRQIADEDVPSAVDSLEFVIDRTEDAANKTMNIVEKHLSALDEITDHLKKLRSPKESVKYLKACQDDLARDLNEIMLAQDFQDLTGQTIRKVIDLVNSIEVELVSLITTFGIKFDKKEAVKKRLTEKITQDDIDSLLKDFGF
jgi:chemotaxis signal transduction protein/chemotaxis regulatin CheY-phosphate phosphatase CheZ